MDNSGMQSTEALARGQYLWIPVGQLVPRSGVAGVLAARDEVRTPVDRWSPLLWCAVERQCHGFSPWFWQKHYSWPATKSSRSSNWYNQPCWHTPCPSERLLVVMATIIPAVPWPQFHIIPLQRFLLQNCNKKQETVELVVVILLEVRSSLSWWLALYNLSKGCPLGQTSLIQVITDASSWRWGAHMTGHQEQGWWSSQLVRASSNFRELAAVKEALLVF